MTASKIDHILEYVYTHPTLLKRIDKLVPKDLRDDMRIHLIEILSKMNQNKVIKLYNSNDIIRYTMRTLHTQMSPKCNNCFHQIYFGPKQIHDLYKSNDYTEEMTFDYETFSYELDETYLPQYRNINKPILGIKTKVIRDVMEYAQHAKSHKFAIFYAAYIDGYTNKEISQMTKVPLQTIINWKVQFLKEIKNYLINSGTLPNNN